MNVYHKYEVINNNLTCVIYIYYPTNYEFGLDFNSIKKKVVNLSDKVKEYILNLSDKINNEKVLIVLNGVVVGTLLISSINYKTLLNENINQKKDVQIIDEIKSSENNTNKESILSSSTDNNLKNDSNEQEKLPNKEINTVNENENKNTSGNNNQTSTSHSNITSNKVNTSNKTNTSSNKNQINNNITNSNNTNSNNSNINTNNNSNTNSNTNNNNNNNVSNNTNTPIISDKKVNLKLNNGSVISIDLEEYIIGVVGAEMPASFNIEALKAQAVAARTYAMDKVSNSQTLTATTSSQCYKTNDELKKDWGNSFSIYYSKIKEAVTATKGQVLKYNGKYIDAVYFSMSNGKTEDAQNVWGNSFGYLKSVDSPYDANLPKTVQSTTIPKSVVSSKLGITVNSLSEINIVSKTVGDRVNIVNIGGKNFTGLEVRAKLNLRSTDFTISESGDNFIFTTKGYGHGVGMSQYGANEMGKRGYSYINILTHYYTGVTISKI